jgi:hypothetical protein
MTTFMDTDICYGIDLITCSDLIDTADIRYSDYLRSYFSYYGFFLSIISYRDTLFSCHDRFIEKLR